MNLNFFTKNRKTKPKSGWSGFTLIELLVASGIFVAIMVMVVASFASVTGIQDKVIGLRGLNQSARLGMESIGQLVRQADSTGKFHGMSVFGVAGFNIEGTNISVAKSEEEASGLAIFSSALSNKGGVIFLRSPAGFGNDLDGQLIRKDIEGNEITDEMVLELAGYQPIGGKKMTVENKTPFKVATVQQQSILVDRYPESGLFSEAQGIAVPFPETKLIRSGTGCRAQPSPRTNTDPGGNVRVKKTITGILGDCTAADIKLEIENISHGQGVRKKLDLALVLDYSGSMGCNVGEPADQCTREGNKYIAMKGAVDAILGILNPNKDRVGAVLFRDRVFNEPNKTHEGYNGVDPKGEIRSLGTSYSDIQSLVDGHFPQGGTGIQEGVLYANQLFDNARWNEDDVEQVMLVLSDGLSNVHIKQFTPTIERDNCQNPTIYPPVSGDRWANPDFISCLERARDGAAAAADSFKSRSGVVYAVGYGLPERDVPFASAALKGLASDPDDTYYFAVAEGQDLTKTFSNIIHSYISGFTGQNMQVIETLPSGISFSKLLNGTREPKIDQQTLSWTIGELPADSGDGSKDRFSFTVLIDSAGPRLVSFDSPVNNNKITAREKYQSQIKIQTSFSTRSNYK